MKITKARLRQIIKEEMDAMRGADRLGAGIENIAQPEGVEPIDVLMDVKARLAGMSDEELMQLAADLDGDMVTALRHILSDKMYDQGSEMELEEGREREVSIETKLAMARGTAEQEAKYHKVRDQGYGDSEARRFVYGRSYSAMGQR
jgi:hypothetical protein